MLNSVSNYGKQVNFSSFKMQDLRNNLAKAKEQGKGVEIKMSEVDQNFLSDTKLEGTTCIATQIDDPWGSVFGEKAETVNFYNVQGYVDKADKKTGYETGSHILLVDDKDVCTSHDISGIVNLPE